MQESEHDKILNLNPKAESTGEVDMVTFCLMGIGSLHRLILTE